MYDIDRLLALVNGRNGLCSIYEETMESLISCDEEQLILGVDKLVELSNAIEDINSCINTLAEADSENGDNIRYAVYNRGSRAGLNEALQIVYDTAQEGFGCLNRARNASSIVSERLANYKDELDKKIRSLSIQPKIISYLNRGVSTEPASGNIDNSV